MNKIWKTALKAILWTVGGILTVMILLEIVLSGAILTNIVERLASEYVDGEIHFGKVQASMFRRFPATTLTLEDFHITYPADRFDESEKAGIQGHLMYRGCGEHSDTLASFNNFSVGVNLPALLSGRIDIPYMRLDHPRIFAHSYADGSSNWNIFAIGESEGEEVNEEQTNEEQGESESQTEPMKLSIGRIMMTGRPQIVYTDSKDSIFAMINLKRLVLAGRIKSEKMFRQRIGLTLDSMFVAGRLGRDTLAAGVDRLYLHEEGRSVKVEGEAKTFLATASFGRVQIPIAIDGTVSFPQDSVTRAHTDNLQIRLLNIPIDIKADATFGESTLFDAKASIPETTLTYAGFPGQELTLRMDLNAKTDNKGKIDVSLADLKTGIKGVEVSASGKARDIFGADPLIDIDACLDADIDTIMNFLPDTLGIEAAGRLRAEISGRASLSQLDIYNFSKSSLTGKVFCDSLTVKMPEDTISCAVNGLKITLGPEEKVSRRDSSRTFRLMGISGEISKADISYKDALTLKTSDFKISAKNIMDADTTVKTHPFSGKVSARKLMVRDSEGSVIRLDNSSNTFNIFPKKEQPKVPVLTFTSRNQKIFVMADAGRVLMSDADIHAKAAMNTMERRKKTRERRISSVRNIDDEDFQGHDIDISLDKSLARYFREWELDGRFSIRHGMLLSPYFPLRNTLQGFDLTFSNDRIGIEKFGVRSGDSDISATGELIGLKRALLGRKGVLKLNADIVSGGMNAGQLLNAYSKGCEFDPKSLSVNESDSDEEYLEQIVLDTADTAVTPSLIVIPANLNANISLNASDIVYSDLHIDTATARLKMQDRCIQIMDTRAHSNMGEINLEGFYATHSKKDIKAGFALNFKEITAEKVINLMPAIDTMMPLLKSFGGLLDCELTATAGIDTNMNIIMPSINGVIRIGGNNLTIKQNEMFRKIARLLVFKNAKEGHIDNMTVEGIIKDSKVEIFPFILEMDRYMLGLSGIQNMDMSFRYHASLIRSPFLVKLGMDIYGTDFDNMKFKIGKAKYKNRNVPVFSAVIDETRINLARSIRSVFDKGADRVIREHSSQKAIDIYKDSIGYISAVDQEMDELSAAEQKQLNEQGHDETPAEL